MSGPVNVSHTNPFIPTTVMGPSVVGGIGRIGGTPADKIIKIFLGVPMGVYINGSLFLCHFYNPPLIFKI
jgi:hypothetical protein